jgi:secondary thiamine-phosphate synthase enzyme
MQLLACVPLPTWCSLATIEPAPSRVGVIPPSLPTRKKVLMDVEMLTVSFAPDIDPDTPAPAPDTVRLGTQRCTGTAVAFSETFAVHTSGVAPAFFDVTDLACAVVRRSGVWQGHLLASTAHTTCALIVQENEPLLLRDLADRLHRFASPDELYRHNQMDVRTINMCGIDECANGHSHCQHAVLGSAALLPVQDGSPALGRWQRLLLVELDHPRHREFTVQVTGVGSLDAEHTVLVGRRSVPDR